MSRKTKLQFSPKIHFCQLIPYPGHVIDVMFCWSIGESLSLAWRHTVKAHVQAITCLAVQGSRLITGTAPNQ